MNNNPAPEIAPLDEIKRLLGIWTRRYRWQRAIIWTLRGLAVGLFASGIVALGLLAHESLLPETFLRLTLGFGFGSASLAGAVANFWPVSPLWAAQYFDVRFGLKERVSTALETSRQNHTDGGESSLLLRQRQDALTAARQVDSGHLMPVRIPVREISAILLMILVLAGLFQFGQPAFQAALQSRLEQQALLAQNEKIAALITEIERSHQLSPEQQQALIQPLRQAQQDLSQADSSEQGVSILTRTEGELHSLSSPQLEEQIESLQALGEILGGPLEDTGRSLAEGDLEGAVQELEDLNPGELSPQEQAGLAEDLEAAASTLQSNQPELAGSLRSAAQALRGEDAQAAQSHLADASQALRETAWRAELSQAAEQAAAALNQDSQQLAQQSQTGAATGQASGASSGPETGQSSTGESSGSPGGEDSGGSTSGAGQGESQGQSQPGADAGSQSIESANSPGDGGERVYEPIYAPSRLGGDGEEEVQLPGSQSPGDEITGESPVLPEEMGGGQVPYIEVFPQYQEAARQAMESMPVPPHLRSLVRDYFSALEP